MYTIDFDRDLNFKLDVVDLCKHGIAVKVECFNKEEADDIKKFVLDRVPDARILTSWLVFKEKK